MTHFVTRYIFSVVHRSESVHDITNKQDRDKQIYKWHTREWRENFPSTTPIIVAYFNFIFPVNKAVFRWMANVLPIIWFINSMLLLRQYVTVGRMSDSKLVSCEFKTLTVSLSKKLYPLCLVLVGSSY